MEKSDFFCAIFSFTKKTFFFLPEAFVYFSSAISSLSHSLLLFSFLWFLGIRHSTFNRDRRNDSTAMHGGGVGWGWGLRNRVPSGSFSNELFNKTVIKHKDIRPPLELLITLRTPLTHNFCKKYIIPSSMIFSTRVLVRLQPTSRYYSPFSTFSQKLKTLFNTSLTKLKIT